MPPAAQATSAPVVSSPLASPPVAPRRRRARFTLLLPIAAVVVPLAMLAV
ncbi:MAG: hypothetical protein JWR00_3233, partial [Rubritepida sp.]|nr:hypothetical protein [Rubritepida sp.]